MRYLTIGNGIRTEVMKCGVGEYNLPDHKLGRWCAGFQTTRLQGNLFEAVRVYLDHLWASGSLTETMSDAERIDNVYVCYPYLMWETNMEQRGAIQCGGIQKCPEGMRETNSWHGTFLAEGLLLGLPESVFDSLGVRRAFIELTAVTRPRAGRGILQQAHCCTAHCTDPAPPIALAHANLPASAHHRPAACGSEVLRRPAHGDRRAPCRQEPAERRRDSEGGGGAAACP